MHLPRHINFNLTSATAVIGAGILKFPLPSASAPKVTNPGRAVATISAWAAKAASLEDGRIVGRGGSRETTRMQRKWCPSMRVWWIGASHRRL
jgi:hypothetical protein